ncbi:MAG: LptA/OstA family protein [SAR86 cluster bacterium]|nr:LptA/OstA family protein [SAR86 cluster bacterium]
MRVKYYFILIFLESTILFPFSILEANDRFIEIHNAKFLIQNLNSQKIIKINSQLTSLHKNEIKLASPKLQFFQNGVKNLEVHSLVGGISEKFTKFNFKGLSKFTKYGNDGSILAIGTGEWFKFTSKSKNLEIINNAKIKQKKFELNADKISLDLNSMKIIESTNPQFSSHK